MKCLSGLFFIILPSLIWAGGEACPAIGTNVELRQADEVYEYLSSQEVEPKGEFETTAEFEKRKNQAYQKLAAKPVMTISGNSNMGFEYDADNQRFAISENGVICKSHDSCLCDFNNYPTEEIGCTVDSELTEVGTYIAENSFGASVTVKQSKLVLYEIFMKPGESDEFSYNGNTFYVHVPIEKAKKLKEQLQIGYVVKLTEPFSLNDVVVSSPTLDNPFETL